MMRIDLYELNTKFFEGDFSSRLQAIADLPLQSRIEGRPGHQMRMEAMSAHSGFYLCDFTKFRNSHGPALVCPEEEAKGVTLQDGQVFGEETALLWSPEKKHLAVQYNHYGCHPVSIANYIGQLPHSQPEQIEFLPVVDQAIQQKIRDSRIVSKFKIRIAAGRISNEEWDAEKSLGYAIKSCQLDAAEIIEVSFSAGKKKGGLGINLSDVNKWIHRPGVEGSVFSASANSYSSKDGRMEEIDLLLHRIKTHQEVAVGPDLRYPRQDRWNALMRAFQDWKPLMKPK